MLCVLRLWDQHYTDNQLKEDVRHAICYTLVTMPIPIILPKISDDEYENVVIYFGLWKSFNS